MRPPQKRALEISSAERQLLSVRELRLDERFTEALAALQRLEAMGLGPDLFRLAQAERARLLYYVGDFEEGARVGDTIAQGADLAAARAGVARSANLLALNRGHGALAAATSALLRMRTSRARPDDLADALLQLAYVQAHMGDHASAIETARAALRRTRNEPVAERMHGRALCALGFALTYGGSGEALQVLLEAERLERNRGGALWHWAQFCVAVFLRDRGYVQAAQGWLARSGVALRYERAWFALRAGDSHSATTWFRPPIRPDERPFVRVLVAATRSARETGNLQRAAARAESEFRRHGLWHWAWGATWLKASDPGVSVIERTAMVVDLLESLGGRGAVHWGFFDPVSARRVLRMISSRQLPSHAAEVLAHITAWSSPAHYDDHALLGALSLLTIDALASFALIGMTPTEIRALTVALEIWLENGDPSRRELAARLGITDNSVRSVINDVRSKLGIEGRRGIGPIVSWLAEREFLGPGTAMRAVQRLTGARDL